MAKATSLAHVLKEIGYRCKQCTHNIEGRCNIYNVWLASDDGCSEYYESRDAQDFRVLTLKGGN